MKQKQKEMRMTNEEGFLIEQNYFVIEVDSEGVPKGTYGPFGDDYEKAESVLVQIVLDHPAGLEIDRYPEVRAEFMDAVERDGSWYFDNYGSGAGGVYIVDALKDYEPKTRCSGCNEVIEEDDHGTWTDRTGGDVCCCKDEDTVHTPLLGE